MPVIRNAEKGGFVGSVIKKRRKRMAKKKHRKLLEEDAHSAPEQEVTGPSSSMIRCAAWYRVYRSG